MGVHDDARGSRDHDGRPAGDVAVHPPDRRNADPRDGPERGRRPARSPRSLSSASRRPRRAVTLVAAFVVAVAGPGAGDPLGPPKIRARPAGPRADVPDAADRRAAPGRDRGAGRPPPPRPADRRRHPAAAVPDARRTRSRRSRSCRPTTSRRSTGRRSGSSPRSASRSSATGRSIGWPPPARRSTATTGASGWTPASSRS